MTQNASEDSCHSDGAAHAFELVLKRTFDAPPEKVWRAWTDPALLKQWFVPRPWSVADVTIDVRPGGAFNTAMQDPDGNLYPNNGVVLQAIPNRLLVTTDAFTSDWRAAGQPFMVARIEMSPNASGGTDYVATAAHWTEAAMKQHEQMGFHDGWSAASDQLAELLKTF